MRPLVLMNTFWVWTLMTMPMNNVDASIGDKLQLYQACLGNCLKINCWDRKAFEEFQYQQPAAERLLHWSCAEDCGYNCMWPIVKLASEKKLKVPQFYGKWPFIRVWGTQEPLSTLFSVFNGLGHAIMIVVYRREVPRHAPLRWVWHGTAITGINAWLWSTAFHARDVPLTEMLDYFCANSLVLWLFFSFFARIWVWHMVKTVIIGSVIAVIYVKHVLRMLLYEFDYGYNMRFNVFFGVVGSAAWLIWCFRVRKVQHYVWKAVVVVLITNLLLVLELGDFPPIGGYLDAHAIWHGGTFAMPYFWYWFGIEDSLYLLREKVDRQKDLDHIVLDSEKQKGS